jgi:hypothetical protein
MDPPNKSGDDDREEENFAAKFLDGLSEPVQHVFWALSGIMIERQKPFVV